MVKPLLKFLQVKSSGAVTRRSILPKGIVDSGP